MSQLQQNYHRVKQSIANLCEAQGGRDQPSLLAVSKTKPAAAVHELFTLGHRYFGENYLNDLAEKANELSHLPITWSYIGQLQSNKIKKIVRYAAEIQALASLKHAALIGQAARELGKAPYPVFLSVNLAAEASKGGLELADIPAFYQQIAKNHHDLDVKGLMAIPPPQYSDANCADVPAIYQQLRAATSGIGKGQLSLGMSQDLRIALQAGTNIVRIGTDIFGSRDQRSDGRKLKTER